MNFELFSLNFSAGMVDSSASKDFRKMPIQSEAAQPSSSPLADYDTSKDKEHIQAYTVTQAGGRSIRLLTINMFMRPIVNTNGSDHKEGRLQYFCEHYLPHYDVIAFQEMFDWVNTRKQRLIREAKNKGFTYHAISPAPSYFSTYACDGGLITVSRFPIVLSDFYPYQYPPTGDDSFAYKGVLYTQIDLSDMGGSTLHLFHSHF